MERVVDPTVPPPGWHTMVVGQVDARTVLVGVGGRRVEIQNGGYRVGERLGVHVAAPDIQVWRTPSGLHVLVDGDGDGARLTDRASALAGLPGARVVEVRR